MKNSNAVTPVPITLSAMTGKMTGFVSLNGDTTTNTFCAEMQKSSSVCQRGYSQRALKSYRSGAAGRFALNQESLRHPYPMPDRYIPWVGATVVRLFSHGDVEDANMAANVLQIVRAYPGSLFVAWSKNTTAWNAAIATHGKPANLRLIYSNGSIGHVRHTPPEGWDMTFNVVEKGTAVANCHGKCAECMVCYSDKLTETVIIEEVK